MPDADYLRIQLGGHTRKSPIRGYALIDREDEYWAQFKWSLSGWGYAVRALPVIPGQPRSQRLHRAIFGLTRDDLREVDHWDGNKLDCRRSNLRIVTGEQNRQNIFGHRGVSRHRGVTYDKARRKWRATAYQNGRLKHLGYYATEAEAAQIAKAWRLVNMPDSNEARAPSGLATLRDNQEAPVITCPTAP